MDALQRGCAMMLGQKIGPIACLYSINVVVELPKTRIGKILRKEIRSIANAEYYNFSSTILNVAALDYGKEALAVHPVV